MFVAYLGGVLTTLLVLGSNRRSISLTSCPPTAVVLQNQQVQEQQVQDDPAASQQIEEHPPTTTTSNSSNSNSIIYLNHSFAYSLLRYHPDSDVMSSLLFQPSQHQHSCRETHDHDDDRTDGHTGSSDHHNDDYDYYFYFSRYFFLLQQGLDAQKNQAYCSVATAAAILNSLRHASTTTTGSSSSVSLPVDYEYDPYPYATQNDLLNECTSRTVIAHHYGDDEPSDFDGILAAPYGLGLLQTKVLLECHLLVLPSHDDNGDTEYNSNNDSTKRRKVRMRNRTNDGQGQQQQEWTVEAHHVDPTTMTLEQVRRDLIEALTCPLSRVAVNFDRSILGQDGHGHWSPVASYAPLIDAFLILDVAKYKSPSFWVSATKLYESMATRDDCGEWNYPMAQYEMLENDELEHLLHPHSSRNWNKAMKQLQCQSTFRGYLIVKPKDVP
jgi:Phytochelatin synthase